MPSDILGFFQNDALFHSILRFILLYIVVVWVSLVVWVIKDITNRTTNLFLQIISVAIVLVFTPLGIFIYLLVRPQKTLFETYYEAEFRTLEAQMLASQSPSPAPTDSRAIRKLKEELQKTQTDQA